MKKLGIVLTFVLLSWSLFAFNFEQTFKIKTFSVNEGLSQFDASMIIQDHYGLIWVSTLDGLNRYDGTNFAQFRHDPGNPKSIHGNRVLNLYIDSKKNFWVITESGKISRFNYQNEEFEHFDFEPLKYAIVTSFYEDRKKNFWIGTTNGLYRAVLNEKEFKVEGIFLNSSAPGIDNYILSIVENENTGILVGTPSGGVLLSNKGEQIYSPSKFLTGITINSIYKDRNKIIWIATSSGLFRLQNELPNQNTILKPSNFRQILCFGNTNVNDIKLLDDNNYIVLVGKAIYKLQIPQEVNTEIKLSGYSFFENNSVKSMFIDKTKNVWIHSQNKGVAKIDLLQKSSVIEKNKFTEGLFIKSVFKDSKNRLWVGANSNGLFYSDKNEPLKRIEIPGIPGSYFLISPTIVEDKMGDIWLTISGFVYCYKSKEKRVVPLIEIYPHCNKLQSPFAVTIDKYDYLWVGCANGLVRLNLKSKNEKTQFVSVGSLSDMFSSEQISRLVYDQIHNIIWTCTKDNGAAAVFLDKTGKVSKVKRLVHGEDENSIASDHVWSIVVASDSIIWFGTDSGLSYCTVNGDSLTVKSLSTLRLIGNSKIMSIAEDSHRNLWLGTSQALFSYNTQTKVEKRFTVKDGLFTSAMLEGMYVDSANDLLYVGTTNGLNIINTAGQSSNPYPAKVQIVDFLVYGKSIKSNAAKYKKLKEPLYTTKEITLNYKENNFSIAFLATHYNDFDKNMYVYKLEGYDKDSITTDYLSKSASYNKLPAGTYRFWVKASNNDNNWGEKRYITIVVKAAPWLTIWAFIIYACLACFIIIVVFRYLNKETKLKQQLAIKEIESQHEAEMNSMKLRFHTNIAHDIRTPLTLISAPLEDIRNNKTIIENPFLNDRIGIIEKNVSRLLYLVNQFLDFRRLLNDGSTLHCETHFAPTAFTDIKESFVGLAKSKNIRYEFVIDIVDHYLIFDLDKLTKILFNLISNSFKFTPDGGDIYVFVEQQNKKLVLKIVDTGCGIPEKDLPNIFQRFYQAADSINGTGIGLSLVKQLVDLCSGKIEIESKEGQGTQITINLPIDIASEVLLEEPKNVINEDDLDLQTKENEIGKATVLIVEDDDDLRSYLVKSLNNKYCIFESINGQDGFDKALRYTPDLILTDVMMPQVDGVTLIKMVRNDYRTSHIPIIVLTAKAGENEEISALEAGAEDFIAKPFSTKSLLLKITNYLRNKKTQKGEEEKNGYEIKLQKREELFLSKFNKIILENLENPIFSIDFLCDAMSISRMQLHRKMIALLGKSTSEYIREIKLDEAKKYFEKGERDIETVMLKIGVNSSFHFNKNFKARFGMSIHDFFKSITKAKNTGK